MSNRSSWREWTRTIDKLRNLYNIPGVAVSLISNGEFIQMDGLGQRHAPRGLPVTPQTMFHIASTQKSMTSMMIATLVDDGILEWDTPAFEISSQFRLRDKRATRAVTIRHLLGMSSGIPSSAEDRFDVEEKLAEDLFPYMQRVKLKGQPGQRYDYSNVSYALAGYLGVLAAGGSWGRLEEGFEALIQERIFDPIGMTNSTLSAQKCRSSPNFSVSHERHRSKIVVAETEELSHDPLAPCGATKSSVEDMSLYLATQINGGIAPNGKRIVSEQNLHETWKPHIIDPDENSEYALGWVVEKKYKKTILSHEGNFDGFQALLTMIPEDKVGFVLLANMEDDDDEFLLEACTAWLEFVL